MWASDKYDGHGLVFTLCAGVFLHPGKICVSIAAPALINVSYCFVVVVVAVVVVVLEEHLIETRYIRVTLS